MTERDKDFGRLAQILTYCEKIKTAATVFQGNQEAFLAEDNYQTRDVCCFYILQIGELTRGLSDPFKEVHSEIPWKQIRGMRNVVVHKYGEIDLDTLWDVLMNDIPMLHDACCKIYETK